MFRTVNETDTFPKTEGASCGDIVNGNIYRKLSSQFHGVSSVVIEYILFLTYSKELTPCFFMCTTSKEHATKMLQRNFGVSAVLPNVCEDIRDEIDEIMAEARKRELLSMELVELFKKELCKFVNVKKMDEEYEDSVEILQLESKFQALITYKHDEGLIDTACKAFLSDKIKASFHSAALIEKANPYLNIIHGRALTAALHWGNYLCICTEEVVGVSCQKMIDNIQEKEVIEDTITIDEVTYHIVGLGKILAYSTILGNTDCLGDKGLNVILELDKENKLAHAKIIDVNLGFVDERETSTFIRLSANISITFEQLPEIMQKEFLAVIACFEIENFERNFNNTFNEVRSYFKSLTVINKIKFAFNSEGPQKDCLLYCRNYIESRLTELKEAYRNQIIDYRCFPTPAQI